MLFWFLVCTAGRHRALQAVQHRSPCAFGNNSLGVRLSLSVDVEQEYPAPPDGHFASQFFFIKEWLSDFLLCGSLLLIEVIQLGLCRLQTLGHLGEGIVDTGKISARVCTKGCPVGHLSFQQERILLFPSGKFHGYGIAPVAADLHRIGGFDLLAGIKGLRRRSPYRSADRHGFPYQQNRPPGAGALPKPPDRIQSP